MRLCQPSSICLREDSRQYARMSLRAQPATLACRGELLGEVRPCGDDGVAVPPNLTAQLLFRFKGVDSEAASTGPACAGGVPASSCRHTLFLTVDCPGSNPGPLPAPSVLPVPSRRFQAGFLVRPSSEPHLCGGLEDSHRSPCCCYFTGGSPVPYSIFTVPVDETVMRPPW
jgi:hypothetical protein